MNEPYISLGVKGDRDLVNKILAVGREFDVGKGGHYDACSAVVNIWANEQDKPEGWDKPMTAGAFPQPCAYIGSLEWEWDENILVCEFVLKATPYDLLSRRSYHDWASIPAERMDKIVVWLKKKAAELFRLARMHEDFLGTGCPFCQFSVNKDAILNDLIDHVVKKHGPVLRITLGDPTTIVLASGAEGRVRVITDLTK